MVSYRVDDYGAKCELTTDGTDVIIRLTYESDDCESSIVTSVDKEELKNVLRMMEDNLN